LLSMFILPLPFISPAMQSTASMERRTVQSTRSQRLTWPVKWMAMAKWTWTAKWMRNWWLTIKNLNHKNVSMPLRESWIKLDNGTCNYDTGNTGQWTQWRGTGQSTALYRPLQPFF
jgi:hypothetical protein